MKAGPNQVTVVRGAISEFMCRNQVEEIQKSVAGEVRWNWAFYNTMFDATRVVCQVAREPCNAQEVS